MTALPGGAADKLGNRYETWWTLIRLADVLDGKASRMRLEPPGTAGEGVEFWVDEADLRWFEQVKLTDRTWTIERLIKEGVLEALLRHLADKHRARLIASSRSHLESLTKRARDTESLDEFREALTKPLRSDFDRASRTLLREPGALWSDLKLLYFEQHPAESLRRLVHLRYAQLVQGHPDVVINELAGWLIDRLHETITAPMVWAHLESQGVRRRLLVGDSTTIDALAATVARHQRRIEATRPPVGELTHPAASMLVEQLTTGNEQVVVLHGGAGSGKSTLLGDALGALAARGWFAGVVRMDAAHDTSTAAGLGLVADLEDSPAILLEGVSADGSAVLVIDQLDAVSTYSGRMADNYDGAAELLDQVRSMRNLKVVVAVRSVDLTNDPRLRFLLSDNSRVARLHVDQLPRESVLAALQELAIQEGDVDDITVELLRTPLHLAAFARLSSESRQASIRTLPDLYRRLTAETRRDVERRVGHLDWDTIVGTLVEDMNQREALSAPVAVLDAAHPDEVEGLVSAGILLRDDDQLSFFHETYFDYLFAQSFVASGNDLHVFLAQSGQHLFRRAQSRQVLQYLATTARDTFRDTVEQLLESSEIRTHLKGVVISVLRDLDPEPSDWTRLEPIALGDEPIGQQVRSMLGTPAWFDAADEAGRWEKLLSDPTTAVAVENELVVAARHRPERVAELVRPYIGSSEEWRHRLRAIIEWSIRPELTELAVELIERGEVDDARGPIAINSDFWSIVYGLAREDPAAAARVTGAYLRRAAVRAAEHGHMDPFDAGYLPDSSAGGESHILEIAESAPLEFANEVLPFVRAVAENTASAARPRALKRTPHWSLRYTDTVYTISDAVFHGVESALRELAATDQRKTRLLIAPLLESDIEELRFLGCRTLAAAEPADEAIDWLLADDRNLQLGWADNPSWATRELIKEATQRCGIERVEALAARLVDYYPDWERSKDGRGARGRRQYELLSAIDPSRLDHQTERRLKELQRRFEDVPLMPPQPIQVHAVGPPVPEAATPHMSDEDWLRAIRKYRQQEGDWSGTVREGGAPELAGLLGSQAEIEPERFAKLALRFDRETPVEAFDRVIRAVAGKVPSSALSQLCRYARDTAGEDVGRAITHAVSEVGADIDDVLLELLEECAADTDPDSEMARTRAGADDYYYGGDLLTAGLNSTRGGAAYAVSKVLYASSAHAGRLTRIVTNLAQDPILGVRVWAAEATIALLNHDPDTALHVAERLFDDDRIDVFDAITTARLLTYSVLREPRIFALQVHRALNGPEAVARHAGGVWAAAYVHDLLNRPIPNEMSELSPAARLGVARAFRNAPSAAPELVSRLLDDDDPDVREAAAAVMRSISDAEADDAEDLINAFVVSRAYPDHFDGLFHALERSRHLLTEAVLVACERAIEIAGGALGDIRTRQAGASADLITVILRLYRQGGPEVRRRCLDAIDKLVEIGAYDVERALASER